jgi:hypothetical protein
VVPDWIERFLSKVGGTETASLCIAWRVAFELNPDVPFPEAGLLLLSHAPHEAIRRDPLGQDDALW